MGSSPAKSVMSALSSSGNEGSDREENKKSLWSSFVDMSSPAKSVMSSIVESSPVKISKAVDFIQQVVSQEAPTSNEDETSTTLPWSNVLDPTKREDIRKRVLALSKSKSTFLSAPPESVSFEFEMTKDVSNTAQALLKLDTNLQKARYDLVRPRRKLGAHVIEKEFWRNYFYHVSLITDEFEDEKSFQEEHFGRTSKSDQTNLSDDLETTLKLLDDDLALTTKEEEDTGSPVLNSTDLNAALELDLASEDFSIPDSTSGSLADEVGEALSTPIADDTLMTALNSLMDGGLKDELGLDDKEWELLNDS